jgi:D-amino-acid dehydrogenase
MRVAIIGAGIIGVASAYHLLKAGHEVVLLDAATPGSGSSHANAGWIVPADCGPVAAPGMVIQALKWMLKKDSPLYVRPSPQPRHILFMLAMARRCNREDFRAAFLANLTLAQGTIGLLDAYAADGVRFEMRDTGFIQVFADPARLEQHWLELDVPQRYGIAAEVLSGMELAEREPALSPSLAGGIHFSGQRRIRPDSLMSGLVARCRALGAQVVGNARVTGAMRNGASLRAVATERGEIQADQFLLAAGAHSGPMSGMFGSRLPVRPGKGYSVDYSPAPIKIESMLSLEDARVAVTPLDGALRLAGTMEFAGLDTEVNQVRVAAIRRAPTSYFSDASWSDHAPSTLPWAGMRPMTPDGLPIIGKFPRLDNAWVATGHGMLGMTMGPATGQAIAEAIGGADVTQRLAPFHPDRFDRHPEQEAAW